MRPTHTRANSHRPLDANNANASKNPGKPDGGFIKRVSFFVTLTALVIAMVGVYVSRAANQTWGANAGTAWYTPGNWAGGAFPGLQGAAASNTDIATWTNAATATSFGINMTTASLNLGAISIDSARTTNTNIGDSGATAGSLRLFGATVNGVPNVILRNNSTGLLTLQAAQNGTMGVVLSNATDNIIDIDNTGGVTITSIISGANKLTLGGAGAGTLTLSGVNSYSGDTTISSGKLALSGAGSIANSPNIILAGGSTFDVIGLTTSLTLASGQGLKGSGTATTGTIVTSATKGLTTAANSPLQLTAFNGATAPLTISGAGTVTLASGNPVTVNTTTPLTAGDYVLIAKGVSGTVGGSVPTSLTIGGSGLATGGTGSLLITGQQLILRVTPTLDVTNNPTVTEGDAGTILATFNVTLSPVSTQTVTVHYSTQDNSATTGDSDYVGIADTVLQFDPGQTSKNINVTVNGDTKFEPNEQFFFNINTPSNANISDNQGIGTITNDDAQPVINVTNNPTVTEGNAGPTLATFNVALTNSSSQTITVHYSTQNDTATTGDNDYVAIPDTLLTFNPGETSKNIDVTVNGDTTFEATEQFFFNINTPSNANISDNQGIGTITNDDAAPATLVVTKTADTNATCLTGNCSLREAIEAANSNPGDANTINFNIPNTDPGLSGGVYTISPSSALPDITGTGTTIDGASQTAFGGDTNAAGPEVEINGVAVTTPPLSFIDGLVMLGGNGTVKGLIISGFNTSGFFNRGIRIESSNNTVRGNYIGTNKSGTAAVPNGDGVLIKSNSTGNTIGGSVAGQGNVISGNAGRGLVIEGASAGSVVQGNFIGTNASGTAAVANQNAGVEISAGSSTNAIGAATAGARNVISGNLGDGVKIDGTITFSNNVQGNYIGTNAAGTSAIGNAAAGVRISDAAGNNHIGGLSAGVRNIISGNGSGVIITGAGTSSNHVEGNYIGTDVTGTSSVGNQEAGVDISGGATNNFVGDADASARNVISGNIGSLGTPAGVLIRDAGTNGNTVQSNYIGVAPDGSTALGNTGGGSAGSQGVFIKSGAANNIIGGSDPANEGNIIANNTGDGVRVWDDAASIGSTSGNSIRGNSIYSNTKLGINLFKAAEGDGVVTPNDAQDTDNGPNGLQNFPIITTAVVGSTTVSGTLNSTPGVQFDIDVYSNLTCDGTNGEGRTFLSTITTAATNGGGDVAWSVTVPALVSGQIITATATSIGVNGDTSEFSACYTVTAAGETTVAVSGANLVITDANGGTTADTLTISLNGSNVRINDPNNTLTAGVGATQIDPNTVEVPFASISGGNIQVNTLGGNDLLTLNFAGGNILPTGGLSYAGGTQTSTPGDKLAITGGTQGTVTYNYTNPNDGSIVMSGYGTVSYTGLEPITNSGTAADVIFNLPAGPNAATLADDGTGGNTLSRLSGATFEATTFANPTGSVTINRGNAADTIAINAMPDLNSSLTLGTTANPFSTITFNGAITFAANKNLSGDASGTVNLSGPTSDLLTSGTGTISLKTARNLVMAASSSLETVNGGITVEANQQVGPTAGNFIGVDIASAALVRTTGSGNISLLGKGGTDAPSSSHRGIRSSGTITSTSGAGGAGTIILNGVGGTGSSGNNGVEITGTTNVSSVNGNISVTGQGGAATGSSNYGIAIAGTGAVIQSTGTATVTLMGTGGAGVLGNTGVNVDVNAVVTSAVGDIQITGQGSGTSASNLGVIVGNGGTISSTGAAKVTVNGTGGSGGTTSLVGVLIQGVSGANHAKVTSTGGDISITGQAGSGSVSSNIGIVISAGGAVTATGVAKVTMNGTGSSGTINNAGVYIDSFGTAGTAISAVNGDISITGVATDATGTDQDGVHIGDSSAAVAVAVTTTGTGILTINGTAGNNDATSAGINFVDDTTMSLTGATNSFIADTMDIGSSAVTVNAGANAITLRQKTNAIAIDLGGADSASQLGLTDTELDRFTAGTMNIGNASSGAITVSANITRAAATALSITSAANIDIAGGSLNSNGGNVNVNPGTNVFPSHSGVDVTTGAAATLTLASGKDLKSTITSTTVDTGYTQLNVAGLVNLNNANLSFAGSTYTPVGGDSFIIVNNDGADAITGTFANGPTFTNFLGSGLTATISYTGGDGNDAQLTVAAACTPPGTVYVDDSWVGTPLGTDPDGGASPASNFGCDSFATIQGGVNGVTASGTVIVNAGNYVENVTIPKALTLTGAGAASVFLRPAVSNPNCGGAGGGSICAGGSNLILVQADNATISGLTLDGDNTTLTSGEVFGGADIDARNGIITNHLAGVFNNLEVHHTTIKNIWLRGVYASTGGSFNFHDNTVQNVQASVASIGMFNFGGAGAFTNNNVSACNDAISSNHSRGTTYTGNTVTTSASGIHTDNAGDGGGTNDTISGNTVTNSQTFGYGIWVYVAYKTVNVQNNTVTNTDVGYAVFGDSGVTTSTAPASDKNAVKTEPGRVAPLTVNVIETDSALQRQFVRSPIAPNAPPAPPYAASFTGNTADGQNKANSTGVYFTTSQIAFGSGNPKVKFFSNTVLNNVDGFYLEAETGFTLETAASFNRIVNNTGSQVTQNTGAGFAGSVNGSIENNWWGCNAGPGNTGCGVVVGPGVDFNPWIVLGISASPATIPPGGSSTITADMTHNSVNAVPSVTDFVPQVAVTFGAPLNGSVLPTSGTITNGQATTTFTSNSTSSGSASATVDNQTVSTPVNVSAANTYTWSPTIGTDWINPLNWTPIRVIPQTNDNLVINGTPTPAPIITSVPTQTIAGLHLINGPSATLQSGGAATLTINGATGSDLTVPAGSFLTLDGANAFSVKLSGAGTIGTIGGGVAAQAGFHRLFGDAGGGITIQSGGIATAGAGLTTNMFGTGGAGDGDAGSVTFASGSSYFHNAGGSPFGTSPNPAVAVLQTGSLATFLTASGFEANGRTYADLAIGKADPGGVAVTATDSGAGNFQFDNLTLNSTSSATSSLSYAGSGASTITIRGNISSTGAGNTGTLPDVTLTSGTGGTHVDKIGGGTLILNTTGNARAIDLEGGATVENGTTLSLARVVLLGISNPHLNTLTVNATAGITGGSNGYVIGSVKKLALSGSFSFPVGTAGAYSPVDLGNASGGDLTVVARTPQQPVLNAVTSLQRYWTLTEGGTLTTDLTFHYLDGDIAGNEGNYRVVVVEAGNATSFPADANHSVNAGANTFTALGISTFSDWTVAEPNAPTAVQLASFDAIRTDNEVMVQWRSGYEARNLGYNIYREQNGVRTRITPSLVAGSALTAGLQTEARAGFTYTWYDGLAKGKGHSAESTVGGVTYWLEDVDLNGARTLHGPIAPSIAYGAPKGARTSRSDMISEVNASSSHARGSGVLYDSWVSDRPPLSAQTVVNPNLIDLQRAVEMKGGIKISIKKDGWYRITQPQLIAAGLDPNANMPQLQLYANGRVVPIKQSGDEVHLTPADYIEFYARGVTSPTDAAQTYYLVLADTFGLRIHDLEYRNPDPLPSPTGPTGFDYTVERKERMIYFSSLQNGDLENFFGQIVSSTAASSTLPVTNLDPAALQAGTPAQLEVALQGVTNQAHQVKVKLNGTEVGTIDFANTGHPIETFDIAPGMLLNGNNTIELISQNGASDVSLVDTLRLTYTHTFKAESNLMSLIMTDESVKRVGGFTSHNIRVLDITDPQRVEEITRTVEINPEAGGSTYSVDMRVLGASFRQAHTLLLFTADGEAPAAVVKNNASDLWNQNAGADYVMITTGVLKDSIEPLAQFRRSQGLVVNVVDVEDLYDEYSFGLHTPQAIRDYLEGALTNWTRKPKYVLFAGDASYDPKNYFNLGMNDLVPTKLIETSLSETASDDWLVDFDNDGLADISIGRLPVRTAASASLIVNKIISYENSVPDPARGAMLVSDTSFTTASGTIQSLLPNGLPVENINRGTADDATIHNQIVASLNQGPRVANYFGHGSHGVWTGASLLSSNDAPSLTNTNHLTVFTMMTCLNGIFQDAVNESLSEALLKSQGGAVAVWASSGFTEPAGQVTVDQEFYRLIFAAQPATLGDASRAAKATTSDPDVRRTWTLFGDPAMKIK